jgi:hypothetical protein
MLPAIAAEDSDSTKVKITNLNDVPPALRAELNRTFEGISIQKDPYAITDPITIPNVFLADSTEQQRDYAHGLLERVTQEQRFLESIDALSEVELPIGIVKAGGILDYTILIDRINFTTQGATMDVFVSLALPQSDKRIAFKGKIPLSKEGGIAGTAKVSLLGDHYLQLSANTLLTIKGSDKSYVEFDCNGFKGINLTAQVEFSRDMIIPENPNGTQKLEPERVKVEFTTYAQSLNDLMVAVTFPPFQVKGLKNFGFHIQQAYMDWSDLANPPGLQFPEGYTSPFIQAGMPNLWQGFYLQRLDIKLPPSFAQRGNKQRLTIGVERMILDDQGFTGKLFAQNVIAEGDMSGWQYTLDKVAVELVTNQVKGFELAGLLSIPVVKTKDGKPARFGYLAQRGADGNYIFAVSVQSEVKLPLFVADVKLFPGSSVTVKEKNDKFYPSASLNGELSISALSKGPKATFSGIRFERMIISSEAPHFTPGTFSFGKEGESSSVSKFPLVINNITVKSEGGRVGLGLDVTINIGGKPEEEGFGGTGSLIVWGKREVESTTGNDGQDITSKDDWKFDKIELTGIAVNIKKPNVIELAGSIKFFDADPTYGDGFKGAIKGTIGKMGVSMSIEALFGKMPTYRYWYADALVEFKSGIPIVPGVLSAMGFGGGFYYKMKQSAVPIASTLGLTPSNVVYVPDENSLGVRAIMKIGTLRPEAMNGDVSFEIAMNKHGGINSVTFAGNANFMSLAALGEDKLKELATSAAAGKLTEKLAALIKGQVFGSMKLHFDNVNDVFHGNFEIYVNVAGGIIRGVSSGNKAGWAVLHFDKNEWYIHIGTPDQPIGLEVARIFKSKSYFMLGHNLPGSPPPPQKVSEILGNIDLDYMRDLNALGDGNGIAFGLHFIVDTGDMKFLMFYGSFSAGAGLDFMLKDYGDDAHCSGSSETIGIDGWFANGQAYAFVEGKVGIKVKLRFIKGNFDILKIGVAAVLQAKGPNPFWMRGIVGGQYRILGGLVKGNCKFEVTIGKDCQVVRETNPLEDVAMIAEISPVKGSSDVDVFNAPQVAFNIPIGEQFDITDKENIRHLYRSTLKELNVLEGTSTVAGDLRWNQNNDVVAFDSYDVLPPQKEIKVSVKIAFEEYKNGQWTTAIFQGEAIEEKGETTFKTAQAPDYIPANNVVVSYPLPGMYNFYPKEYTEGFVELKKGQPYLFDPQKEWIQKIHFTESTSKSNIESNLSYNAAEKRVYYTISRNLLNSKFYTMSVVNIPAQSTVLDANITKIEREVTGGEDAGQATITTKAIEGNLELRDVKTIYASHLRTSNYNTFTEKASAVKLSQTFRLSVEANIFQLGAYMVGQELFDNFEISGGENYKPLVQYEAGLEQNDWFNNYAKPIIYEGYPLLGKFTITSRDINLLGLLPTKSVFVDEYDYNPVVTKENLGISFEPPSPYSYIVYDLMVPMYSDYRDIQRHVAGYITNNPDKINARFERILINRMPMYRYGKYNVKLKYVIPGVNKEASHYDWEMFNEIPD